MHSHGGRVVDGVYEDGGAWVSSKQASCIDERRHQSMTVNCKAIKKNQMSNLLAVPNSMEKPVNPNK
jgi:hypothetical protein